jgi:hypothetical protein
MVIKFGIYIIKPESFDQSDKVQKCIELFLGSVLNFYNVLVLFLTWTWVRPEGIKIEKLAKFKL